MSEKASRLLRIYSKLRKGPLTIYTLKMWAKKNGIEVSERTLYRDLEEIQKSISLEEEKIVEFTGEKNKKTWKIEFATSTNDITEDDINSFYLFKNFAPLALIEARNNSLEQFENKLYKAYSKGKFEKNETVINAQIKTTHFYELPYAKNYHKILDDFIWAIQNKRKVLITEIEYDHTSLSKSTKFPFHFLPLQILYHRGCIHIAGISEVQRKIIILAVEQLKDYNYTNDTFAVKKNMQQFEAEMQNRFGITENMDNKLYNIQIEFSQLTGSFVSNHFWHISQIFTQLSNGNYLLKLKCGINRELAGWIFQWMNNAKVVKPFQLKKLVLEKISQTQKLYTGKQSLTSSNIFRAK